MKDSYHHFWMNDISRNWLIFNENGRVFECFPDTPYEFIGSSAMRLFFETLPYKQEYIRAAWRRDGS